MDLGAAFLNPIQQQQQMDESAAMAPLLRAHQEATTRMLQAEAGQMEYNLEGEKKAGAAIAQQIGSGQGGTPSMKSPADLLAGFAQSYAEAGLPDKATKALEQSELMRAREATTEFQLDKAAHTRFLETVKKASMISNLLGGVKDQASWDQANQTYSAQTGEASPYANYPYDPKFVKSLQDGAMSAKEKAELAIKNLDLQSKQANRASAIQSRSVRDRVAEARLEVSKARESRLSKAGGKDVGAPSSAEVKQAGDLLDSQPGLVAPADKNLAAADIAAQARALRRANPGLTQDEALRKALADKKAQGDFQPGKSGFLGFGSKPPSYSVPIAPPKLRKDLVEGQHYKDPSSGKVMEWTKDGWKGVGASPTKAGTPAASSEGGAVDDEEDDDAE